MKNTLENMTNEQLEQILQVRKGVKGTIKPMISTGIMSGSISPRLGRQGITLMGVREDFQGIENQFRTDMEPISRRFFDSCMELIERNRTKTKEESVKKLEKEEIEVKSLEKSRKQDMFKKAKEAINNQAKPSIFQKTRADLHREHWSNRATAKGTIGAISSDALRFLKSLPQANWEKVYGGMPTTPGYPYTPTICPKSVFTNLKRIFFSGVNVLAGLDQLIAQGKTDVAKEALNQLGSTWNQWLDAVKKYHGNTQEKVTVLDALKEVIDYVFKNTNIEEFKSLFNNLAFAATNPERLFQLVSSQLGGIKGSSLSY